MNRHFKADVYLVFLFKQTNKQTKHNKTQQNKQQQTTTNQINKLI